MMTKIKHLESIETLKSVCSVMATREKKICDEAFALQRKLQDEQVICSQLIAELNVVKI